MHPEAITSKAKKLIKFLKEPVSKNEIKNFFQTKVKNFSL